ncbi:HD domain-containing protein [Sulfuriferula nivalis]|uniref:HD/PDEase domain-containing protein n=1 Tax=Sulfuriferula nivalis TaxID=2675298 RepID=A0A809RG14_9PROT|nr:TraI domain-containing protein [Sulfuriferula nivalis]BBP00789.1 hypothetical protein SFSGTM_14970 [Sulfuriferula nivalis]
MTISTTTHVSMQEIKRNITSFNPPISLDVDYLYRLANVAKRPNDLMRLVRFAMFLNHSALQQFIWALLKDEQKMLKFVTLPASGSHHHAYPGGLLEHSLDVALLSYQWLRDMPEVSINEQELTLCAALLHDFGKVITMTVEQGYTPMGYAVQHDELTIASLEPYFSELARNWPEGASALAYMLTWHHRKGHAKYATALIVKSADQVSAAINRRNAAFANKPDHYYYQKLPNEGCLLRVG